MKNILCSLSLLLSSFLYSMEKPLAQPKYNKQCISEIHKTIKDRAFEALASYRDLQQQQELFFSQKLKTAAFAALIIKNTNALESILIKTTHLHDCLKTLTNPKHPTLNSLFCIRGRGFNLNKRPLLQLKQAALACLFAIEDLRPQLKEIWCKNGHQWPEDPTPYVQFINTINLNFFKYSFLRLLRNQEYPIQPLKDFIERPLIIEQINPRR